MLQGMLGRKIGMTQIFNESGECIPVTVVEVGPVTVVQIKTLEKDGYESVQVGYQPITKEKHTCWPRLKRPRGGPLTSIRTSRPLTRSSVNAGSAYTTTGRRRRRIPVAPSRSIREMPPPIIGLPCS